MRGQDQRLLNEIASRYEGYVFADRDLTVTVVDLRRLDSIAKPCTTRIAAAAQFLMRSHSLPDLPEIKTISLARTYVY